MRLKTSIIIFEQITFSCIVFWHYFFQNLDKMGLIRNNKLNLLIGFRKILFMMGIFLLNSAARLTLLWPLTKYDPSYFATFYGPKIS